MRKHPNRILLLIVFWALNLSITTAQSDADKLRALFGEDCLTACFMGIEPGVTTLQEIEMYLHQKDISYSEISDLEYTMIEWELPQQELVTDGGFVPFISVIFQDNVVFKIIAPLNVSINTVIEVFGLPNQISDNKGTYYITYPIHNISFLTLDFSLEGRTFVLVSEFSDIRYSEITNPPGEPINQTCLSYGVPPCIIPTATPTLIPPLPQD